MSCVVFRIAARGARAVEPGGDITSPSGEVAADLGEAARFERPGGVYAAFGAVNGRVVRLSNHLDRLEDSSQRVGFRLRLDRSLVRSELCELLQRAGLKSARIRISVHPEDLEANLPAPLRVAMERYDGPSLEIRAHGVSCRTAEHTARVNPRAKQTSWLAGRSRLGTEQPDEEPYEWLLCSDDGRILEGASSTFYAILDSGPGRALCTAANGVLHGVSRTIVLDVAPHLLPVTLEAPRLDDLGRMSEAFLSSASRAIVPIVEINGRAVGDGLPGATTRALIEEYDLRAKELEEPLCFDRYPTIPSSGVEVALQQAKAEAEQQAQEAETLRTAGAIVASTLEIERTVELVLDQAMNVVPYDTATVQLLRDDALEVVGGAGWEDIDAVRGLQIPHPGESPHSRAIETRSVLVVEDMEGEFPRFSNISGTAIRSWLGVPLIVHREVIGLLALDSRRRRFFTSTHVRLAAALGDHVAVALHNARLYEQTRELAMTDSLTGVATRRNFFVQAERALEQAKRNGRWISVIMSDLDHFKEINDEYGHVKGDEALRLVAQVALETLRRSDIIGRYGGDEFAVILPETGTESARTIAERLRSEVNGITVPGTSTNLSISIGVVSAVPDAGDTVDAVIEQADLALYGAKRLGRNRVAEYQAGDR